MNPDKAIEILDFLIGPGMPRINLDEREAIKLGIEAMKWRLKCEKAVHPDKFTPLPGETKD